MEKLTELYWQVFQDEGPLEIEDFLEQVRAGKHGEFSAKEIGDFIDEAFQTMLANIQLKATEGPHYESMREEIEARTEERMLRLKEKYAGDV